MSVASSALVVAPLRACALTLHRSRSSTAPYALVQRYTCGNHSTAAAAPLRTTVLLCIMSVAFRDEQGGGAPTPGHSVSVRTQGYSPSLSCVSPAGLAPMDWKV